MGGALSTIFAAMFDVKHYFHFQVYITISALFKRPVIDLTLLFGPSSLSLIFLAITRYLELSAFVKADQPKKFPSFEQYWRLLGHHLAFVNSSDLFLATLVFYNVGVQVERQFGSVKYAVGVDWS